MNKLSLHLFGQPQIVYNNTNITHTLPLKAQAILFYLAVTSQTQTRLWLGSLLWPDVEESRALKNLRDVLPLLRQQFPDHLLITRQTLAFNRDQAYFLDTELFQNNLQVTALTDEQRHETLNLYQGEFLAGFYVPHADLFGEWQMMWRERLHELALHHMDELVEQAVQRPEKWEMGLNLTQRLLELEPWRESAHRQRMLLLAYAGKRETAVSQYELCRQTLIAEFGIEPTSQTRLLYEQIVAGEMSMSQVVRLADAPSGPAPQLPRTLTPFFGRQEELTAVTNHLRNDQYPLVTIMGEGGIGKTRLAIASAQKVAADFPGGVWFVPLAHLPHAPDAQIAVEQLVGAMADVVATAVVKAHKTTAAHLVQIIGGQHILLVLDNFEHLSAGKNLLLDLLTNCPHLTLLITSRERLNMQAEMVVRLGGLPVPAETQAMQMPNLITMSSLQLFTERASRIAPDFILDDSNLADVVRICQLVEGLPLAIEMAAALTAYQSCAAIRAALTANYNALSALGQDDLPGRHQSLQAVFDYSWHRLTPDEALKLAQCALFQGGFTVAAAAAIIQASAADLMALTQKSLLRALGNGRFDMHEIVRHFAAEKLPTLSIDTAAVQTDHARYYSLFMHQRASQLENETAVLHEIQAEIGNIRAAWQWAAAHNQLETLGQAVQGLTSFYRLTGSYREAHTLLAQTIHQLETPSSTPESRLLLGQLYAAQSYFVQRVSHLSEAVQLAQKALEIGEELADANLQVISHVRLAAIRFSEGKISDSEKHSQLGLDLARQNEILLWEQAQSLRNLGQIATRRGDYVAAGTYFQESLTLAQQIGSRTHEGQLLKELGIIDWRHGAYSRANEHLQTGLEIVRATGDLPSEADILKNLGIVAWFLGDYDKAAVFYEQSLAIYHDIGDQNGASATLNNLGLLAWNQGRYEQSAAYYQQSLHIQEQTGDRLDLGIALGNMGIVSRAQGKYEQAQQYHQQSLAILDDVGDELGKGRTLNNLGLVAANLGQYQQAVDYYKQSLAIRQEIHDQEGLGKTLSNLGVVAFMQEQYEEAAAYHEESLLICREIGDRVGEAGALTGLGMALTAWGQLARAEEMLVTAVFLWRQLKNQNLLMEALTTLASLYLSQQRPDVALSTLEEVLTYLSIQGSLFGTEYGFLNYLHCWRILVANDDKRSEAILKTAQTELQKQIAQMNNPEVRLAFCHNIPWHQQLIAPT